MNKQQFIRSYAEGNGITIKEATQHVNGVFDHILHVVPTLESGEKLNISGVVSFTVTDVPERQVRNPQNSEIITKEATRKVKASAKTKLKKAVAI